MKLRYENGNQAILKFPHLGWHFHGIAQVFYQAPLSSGVVRKCPIYTFGSKYLLHTRSVTYI